MITVLHAAIRVESAFARVSDRDCCVFARAVCVELYGSAVVDRVVALRWHLDVDTGRARGIHVGPFEPVAAAIEAGVADERLDVADGRWHLVQGWRATPLESSGHTFLWRQVALGRGYVLDSTRTRGMKLAGIGPWSEQVAQYRGGLRLAALRVPMGASLG